MQLSIIFPVQNEATALAQVVADFYDALMRAGHSHELIVIDDGSSDATPEILQDLERRYPTLRHVRHQHPRGYGAALRSGFSAATGDFIFFTDGDGQFRADDLTATLPRLNPRTIILGYRQSRAEGMLRRLNSWLWNQLIAASLGFRVRDLNCAWKAFPRTVLANTILRADGAFISAELLDHARRHQLRFEEIPVRHWPRSGGAPTGARPRVIGRAFQELFTHLRSRPSRSTLPGQ